MSELDLIQEWRTLLERRPSFRSTLAPYEPLLAAWGAWPPDHPRPLPWSADECGARWARDVPLLPEAPPSIAADEIENLLGVAMDVLAGIGADLEALPRLAAAWDSGEIRPADLFPAAGRIGSLSVQERTGLSQDSLVFLACAALRPALAAHFRACRPYLAGAAWTLGVCPFCGAPPGFADLLEGGQRRLACHLCGGSWPFSRLRCPHCGNRNPEELRRLLAEDKEEGYAIFACQGCRGYLKELDRRVRWNAGPALVEDWGSPHLDLIAQRAGYWRPVPTLIQLVAE